MVKVEPKDWFGPEKLVHWIHTLGGTGGSPQAGALVDNTAPSKPATLNTEAAPVEMERRFVEDFIGSFL
jgi:hypothetical protein